MLKQHALHLQPPRVPKHNNSTNRGQFIHPTRRKRVPASTVFSASTRNLSPPPTPSSPLVSPTKPPQTNPAITFTAHHHGYSIKSQEDVDYFTNDFVNSVYQAREYYHTHNHELPVYITNNLLALAKNDAFINLLESYKNDNSITFNTQHDVKTRLATAIDSHPDIIPSLSEENFPTFALGRGVSKTSLGDPQYLPS